MKITGLTLVIYGLILITGQAYAAEVSVLPTTRISTPGETFNMNVSIDPQGTAIAGAQLNIVFNSSLIKVNSITEGDLFKQSGANTFFNSGIINNSTGTVINIFNAIIGKNNVSTQGTFIIINATAIGTSGITRVNLSNVKISDPNGNPVGLTVTNGSARLNSPPLLASIGNKIVNEGQTLTFTLSASDADGDSLTYLATGLPGGASFDPAARTFQWAPNYTQSGNYSVHFEVSDDIYVDEENIIITLNIISNTNNDGNSGSSGVSSAGGGGGGAGGTSGEDYNNIQLKEKFDRFINKDIPTSYCFRNAANPIICINITANISPGEINTAVEVLSNTSSLVKDPAPDTVYKNVNIWVGTYGFATPTNIKHAEIAFRVPVSWINSNSIDPDSITMMHYHDVWEPLPTKKISETSEWIYYEASTTRFSPHAITGKRSYGGSYNWISQTAANTDSQQMEKQVSNVGNEAESPGNLNKSLIIGIFIGIVLNAILVLWIRKPKNDILKSL